MSRRLSRFAALLAGIAVASAARTSFADDLEARVRHGYADSNGVKIHYAKEPYVEDDSPIRKVAAPVLLIHGLDDVALDAAALDRTWEWVAKDLTLVTIPGAGHFVQQDAADLVTRTIRAWLAR